MRQRWRWTAFQGHASSLSDAGVVERVGRRLLGAGRDQAPARPGPGQRAVTARPQDQAALLDADAVPRRELGQVGERQLHGAGDVEDRLVAVAKVVGVAHGGRAKGLSRPATTTLG